MIYPELKGKLNGIAIRVPLLNASLTDCVFEVKRATTVEEVNRLLKAASEGPLSSAEASAGIGHVVEPDVHRGLRIVGVGEDQE